MSCERYWKKGIELVERGEPDPHRETCEDCQREHLQRAELIGLFPLIVDEHVKSDPNWQARVWRQVAHARERKRHGIWFFGSAFVSTLVLVLLWWLPGPPSAVMPMAMSRIEVQRRGSPTRSAAAGDSFALGDFIYVHVNPGEEVRLYRNGEMLQQCSLPGRQANCVPDGHGISLEAHLTFPVRYQIMTIERGTAVEIPQPTNSFEGDRRSVRESGAREQHMEITVR